MSEAKTQNQNPNPSSTGSVPVLFSLKNVQPSIVAGATQKVSIGSPGPAPEPPPIAPPTVTPIVSVEAKPRSSSHRLYNGAIAILLLVLLMLAIRNSNGGNAKSIVGNTSPTPTNTNAIASEMSPVSISTQASRTIETGLSNIDFGPVNSKLDLSLPLMASAPTAQDLSKATGVGEKESISLGTDELLHENTMQFPTLLVSGAPSNLPNSITNARNDTMRETFFLPERASTDSEIPDLNARFANKPESNDPISAATSGEGNRSSINFPPLPNSVKVPTRPATNETDVASTGVELKTHEMIDAFNAHKNAVGNFNSQTQSTPAPSTSSKTGIPGAYVNYSPATTYAPATAPAAPSTTTNNAPLMSGQAYPSIIKEYQPLNLSVPAYEQNAINNQPSQAVRPSNANAVNRYPNPVIQQPNPSSTKTPYTPIQAPTTMNSGNSIGYPPSN